MKKILSIGILMIMALALLGGAVNAATTDTLANDLYELGAKYGMTSADKVKIERYLADNPVTEEQANKVMAKANEAVKIMEDNNATTLGQVKKEDREKLKTIANEAASVVDLSITFKPGTAEIYKDGKLIETVTMSNGKLAYTGNNVNIVLVVSSVAIIALAAIIVARKKLANA